MQRIANPWTPVRFRPQPPSFFRLNPNTAHRPDGEIGRHKGFKIPRSLERAGSSPALGTILFDCFNRGFALSCLPNG